MFYFSDVFMRSVTEKHRLNCFHDVSYDLVIILYEQTNRLFCLDNFAQKHGHACIFVLDQN